MTNKELLEKRAQAVHQMKDLNERAAKDGRAMTDDETAQFEKYDAEIVNCTDQLERNRKVEERQSLLIKQQDEQERSGQATDTAPIGGPSKNSENDARYRSAFDKWLRGGMGSLSSSERDLIIAKRGTDPQSTTVAGLGGVTIPQSFGNELIKAMKYYGGMLEVSNVTPTATGAAMPFPRVDETSVKGRFLTENTKMVTKDIAFDSVSLNAYAATSDIVLLSLQLLQDNGINLEAELLPILSDRLGRATNEAFTIGDGNGKPTGVSTQASAGHTATTSDGVTQNDLIDLQTSLDAAYEANAQFMFARSTGAAIRKLSIGNADARGLWQPSLIAGQPDTILGKPFTINNDMAALGAGNVSILYGDFSKYRIRMVRDVTMVEFGEKYMDALQKGYAAWMRVDGNLLDTKAIKKMTGAAS